MTTPNLTAAPIDTAAVDVSGLAGALWLIGAAVFALLAIFFIGLDQGMVSVFGSDLHVHEFVHDGRHFLGFPCH
ncbi:MAG: cobalt transporter [Frankiales bacterium]|nr:cobalt transporter [Frankiales bacterium]